MPSKKRSFPVLRAWAWMAYADSDARLASWRDFGNGRQYQLPVFTTKKDALDWKEDGCGQPGLLTRLSRVKITVIR